MHPCCCCCFSEKELELIFGSFLFFQIVRGNTHNHIFVDESCFVRPTVYREVVPMIMTDKAHMVLTSSHRSAEESSRDYLDMQALRCPEILLNNVAFVCPEHLSAILTENVAMTNCFCYLFHVPHHINADPTYKRISNAFSQWTGKKISKPNETTSKVLMLNEIGILPSTVDRFVTKHNQRLATVKGSKRLCSEFIDVADYVIGGDGTKNDQLRFDRRVVAYIDPTPTDVGRSYHAMCFVAQAETNDRSHTYYVILAVEEFTTDDIVNTEEETRTDALAKVFTTTVRVLTSLYEGYFRTFIVAPEANAIHVDDFWQKCAKPSTRLPEGVDIFSTTISHTRKNKKCKRERKTYRVGYALGKNKVPQMYSFFTTIYNPSAEAKKSVLCAVELWSWTIAKTTTSVPLYISRRLEEIKIKPIKDRTTGFTTKYTIDGKGPDARDDLATSVIMSVCLCEDIVYERYTGDLVRLDNTFNLDSYTIE
jgi:hypothetical protein